MTWNPSQPLPDADDETETQKRANAEARKEYLKQQALDSIKPEPKKRKSLFSD